MRSKDREAPVLVYALVGFALAAVAGLVLARLRVARGQNPPTAVALVHGAVAATSLVVLIVAVANGAVAGPAGWAIGLFVVAALGGLTMFLGFHLRGRPIPIPLVALHGGAAITAFLILLLATRAS